MPANRQERYPGRPRIPVELLIVRPRQASQPRFAEGLAKKLTGNLARMSRSAKDRISGSAHGPPTEGWQVMVRLLGVPPFEGGPVTDAGATAVRGRSFHRRRDP